MIDWEHKSQEFVLACKMVFNLENCAIIFPLTLYDSAVTTGTYKTKIKLNWLPESTFKIICISYSEIPCL
jgi:hypothetical protein